MSDYTYTQLARTGVDMIRTRAFDAVTSLVGGVLSLASPTKAARYRDHRAGYRTYVAGELSGPNQGYRPRNRSADAEIRRGYQWVTARVRDQIQNNPFISGAIKRICNNVVRNGIRPLFQFRDASGKLDRKANDAWDKMFIRWARYADINGHDSYWADQKLGLRHMWSDGQFLVHRIYDTSIPGVVPLRIELIEYDMLDKLVDGVLANGNIARRGKEFDKVSGKCVAFHILDNHPGDDLVRGLGKSKPIPAADIIHVFERDRISQSSGISWLAAVVMEAFDMETFRDWTRAAAKIESAWVAFVHTAFPGQQGSVLGGGMPAGGSPAPVTEGGTGAKAPMPTEINPGMIQHVPGDKQITMGQANRPGSNYEPFVKDSLRGQSVGTGMSFEGFSNNYTESSYASARSGSLEERLGYQGQQFFINEKLNDRVAAWFIEAAWLAGLAPVVMPDYASDPYRYNEMVGWQDPGWLWVDPKNDASAAKMRVDEVLDTRTNINSNSGKNFHDTVETLMEEEEELFELYKRRLENKNLLDEINASNTKKTTATTD